MPEPQVPEDTLDPTALGAEDLPPEVSAEERSAEEAHARRLADRYRLQFLDMNHFRIDQELFRSIPADLMLRYGFVPYRRDGRALVIVVSDPTDLPMIDELRVLLGTPVRVMVGARSAIESILKKSESSQRVLDRRISDPAAEGRRGVGGQPHRRAADERHQSDHPPHRLDDLHGHPAARQ
jgi:type II secretory ATPase GspE/PulE/Tfp pilus assembly ATPase PilB-like protein